LPLTLMARHHEQWHVEQAEHAGLDQEFGVHEISYGSQNAEAPLKLSPAEKQRWTALYKQCLSDGCTFCDHVEGRCADGTCGPNNAYCRVSTDRKGRPTCGMECGYYALKKMRLDPREEARGSDL